MPRALSISACVPISQSTDRLERPETEAAQIDIPLGHSDQLYNLQLHIQLLQQKPESVGSHDAATS
jgi:hypothetical protein